MHRVVVIGDAPQSLAVVRSLGRAGYTVVVVHRQSTSIAGSSRYCVQSWRSPDLHDVDFEHQFLQFLQTLDQVTALFPVGVESVLAMQQLKRRGLINHPIVGVQADLAQLFHNKEKANSVVAEAGVDIPKTEHVETLEQLQQAAKRIGYPVITKSPVNAGPVIGRKALILHNEAELQRLLPKWPHNHQVLMVQRFIKGIQLSCDFAACDGKIVAYYEGRTDHTDEDDGTGFVVDFCAAEPNPYLFQTLRNIVAHTNYSGPGLLQCIAQDGGERCVFVEVNPRLSAGVQEAIHAGIDLPLICLHSALGESPEVISGVQAAAYQVGRRTYWFERDFRGYRRHRHIMSWRQKVSWWWSAAGRWWRCDGHIMLDWSDLQPSLRTLKAAFLQRRKRTVTD